MTPDRFQAITNQYGRFRIGIAGDFCLDRYLELDPSRREVSIETGLPVHNVANVRSQPGGAGTILNNLAALGVQQIVPLGFAGDDGEGYELRRALAARPGVTLDYFLQTAERRTFTYCKPLVLENGKPPRELNRIDQKNWTPTPAPLTGQLSANLVRAVPSLDALILLSQVDEPETGVLTKGFLAAVAQLASAKPTFPVLADSRHGLAGFPSVIFKMNGSELAAATGLNASSGLPAIFKAAAELARRNGRPVFVTLAERGILGASPDGQTEHVPAHPVHGEIDIVGAGDAVTANLGVALAAKATLREALELANAAASIVIHQLGTTGTASVPQLQSLLVPAHD
jgi:rfaE bifunctional protein kinase chain/domain